MRSPIPLHSPLSEEQALALAEMSVAPLPGLMEAAAIRRDRAFGRTVTFSPKVFLPLTNLCRNRCDYCSFRKSPRDEGAHTMGQQEVVAEVERAQAAQVSEALICIGDRPEGAYGAYRTQLADMGHSSTVDFIVWASEAARARGLWPHTNAGVLSAEDMQRLRPTNVSLGLMLENVSPRLCEPGMAHYRAPDKRPARRLEMMRAAGKLHIPFTTGILLGIGETALERVQSLLAIRELHRQYGHIQEVIVQNFMPRAGIERAGGGPADHVMLHTVALARLILDDEVSVQAPPNLNAERTADLLRAGINDFGGISPVTPDFINPSYPWPQIVGLARVCTATGHTLAPRLPIYPRYLAEPYVEPELLAGLRVAQARLRLQDYLGEPSTEPPSAVPRGLHAAPQRSPQGSRGTAADRRVQTSGAGLGSEKELM